MKLALIIMMVILALIGGYILGRFNEKSKTRPMGTLQIDHSDPDMPYLFLLNYDLDHIAKHRQATFDVKVEDFVSR